MEHKKHQEANDWITCKCGKLFANSGDRMNFKSKYQQLKEHIEECSEKETNE